MTEIKPTLVSLGMSCQTTHQLALFALQSPEIGGFTKGPFDWLICPPESLAIWLDSNLIDFTGDEIVLNRDHAYWPKFDLWFWHGFMDHHDDTRVLNISGNMQRELDKLSYQREIFQGLDPANTVFVLSNTQNNLTTEVFEPGEEERFRLTEAVITKVQSSLDRFFDAPTRLHWMTREDRCDAKTSDQPNVYILPAETSDWKGSPENWADALTRVIGL